MLFLAVFYDVQTLVEVDHIACATPAIYYFLGHLDGVRDVPLISVDEVVSSLTIEAVHSPLCKAADDVIASALTPPHSRHCTYMPHQ
jgi:hypothetical protein